MQGCHLEIGREGEWGQLSRLFKVHSRQVRGNTWISALTCSLTYLIHFTLSLAIWDVCWLISANMYTPHCYKMIKEDSSNDTKWYKFAEFPNSLSPSFFFFSPLLKSCPQFTGQLYFTSDRYQGADSAIQLYYLPFASSIKDKILSQDRNQKIPSSRFRAVCLWNIFLSLWVYSFI